MTPIHDWIDEFKSRHTKNNEMHANGSDVESLSVRDASDGEIKCNFAFGIRENSTICEAYFYQGAGLNNEA